MDLQASQGPRGLSSPHLCSAAWQSDAILLRNGHGFSLIASPDLLSRPVEFHKAFQRLPYTPASLLPLCFWALSPFLFTHKPGRSPEHQDLSLGEHTGIGQSLPAFPCRVSCFLEQKATVLYASFPDLSHSFLTAEFSCPGLAWIRCLVPGQAPQNTNACSDFWTCSRGLSGRPCGGEESNMEPSLGRGQPGLFSESCEEFGRATISSL